MALAPLPTRPPASVAGGARRVERTDSGSVLVLEDGRRVALAVEPDVAGAQRCRRSLNHLASVRVDGSLATPRASVRGIGNRLPVTLTITLAAALGLVESGVPAIVSLTDGVDA
jgi:hypothetical protein